MHWPWVNFLVSGCYAELGVGYAGATAPTVHGSFGVAGHFGDAASVRAGMGGAAGPYTPEGQPVANAHAKPVALGGHARVLGDREQLAITADVLLPWGGDVSRKMPVLDESAHVTRGFVGVGYRHSWRGVGRDPDIEAGAVVIALGPELFRTQPTSSALPADTRFGGALSVTFSLRGGALWRFFECLDAKKDRCGGEP